MFRVSRGFLFCLLLAAMPGLCRSPAWRNRCCSTCRCKASGGGFAAHRDYRYHDQLSPSAGERAQGVGGLVPYGQVWRAERI